MPSKSAIVILALLAMLLLYGTFMAAFSSNEEQAAKSAVQPESGLSILSTDFVPHVTNKYFTLTPGTRYTYKAKTGEDEERIEVYVTNDKKEVMGVSTIVVWDRVWLNDGLIEDTKDWYAQDKLGNVWYFGEESKEIVDGKLASTKGSWEAGMDGARPGIIMKANPVVGDTYRQEYYEGEAEDMAEVAALGVEVRIGLGNFTGCLKTKEWNPLEANSEEYKYYCPEIGQVVLETKMDGSEAVQLVGVEKDVEVAAGKEPVEELKKGITEDDAIRIALATVKGKVTDVAIENKFGRPAYVVEIDADSGPETDVIIDIDTGEVLEVET